MPQIGDRLLLEVNRSGSRKIGIGRGFRGSMLIGDMAGTPPLAWIKLTLTVLLLAYVGLFIFALLFSNRLIFPAPPPGYRDSSSIKRFAWNEAGETVAVQYLPVQGARFLLFYQHGNAEDLQHIQPRLEALRQAGFSVLAWDYPGYGTSDGKPSPRRILDSAEALWQQIPQMYGFSHDRIVLYGRSVGGGPATYLASRHDSAGLILESTFTSVFRVALPAKILPWDVFDNLSRIEEINTPLLVLHGTSDIVVPFSHGRKIHDRARDPKYFAWFEGGGHNDLVETYPEIYNSSLRRFMEALEADL